jgi:glucosamine-phosphate N-acetyltransferase
MDDFEYETLWKLIENNNSQIEEIIESYIKLLSQLTETPILSKDEFMKKLLEIKNMGYIYVCYYKNVENKISIVGSGTIIFEPKIIRSGKYVGHIEDIVVDKNFRSMGISKKIIDKLVLLAKEQNCYKVILDCKTNLSQFYEKNGFETHGVQMSKYLLI